MSDQRRIVQFQMDKSSSQAITIVILAVGVVTILAAALIIYGVDVLSTVFGILMPIISILAMYLGFTIQADKYTVANLTQLVAYNQETIQTMMEAINRLTKSGDNEPKPVCA